jgi:predicted small secreted protein
MLRKTLLGIALILPLAGGLTACDDQGPMEEAGEELDQAAENIGEAFESDGPAEEAGEDIDDALGN